MKKLYLGWLLALMMVTQAFAATFYISTTGSDGNSCNAATNIATPRLHFLGSNGVLSCPTAPGDTIYVRAGNYPEGINVDNPGQRNLMVNGTSLAAGGRILVSKYPGDGKVTVGGFRLGDCCSNPVISQFSYWVFDGIDIKGIQQNGGTVILNHIDNIVFQNFEFDGDCATLGICNGVQNPNTGAMCVLTTYGSTGVTFRNGSVHGCGGYGLYVKTAMTFDHVHVYDVYGYGFHIYNNTDNTTGTGLVISNSEIDHVHASSPTNCTYPGAGMVVYMGNSHSVYNTLIHDNEGGAIGVSGGQNGFIFYSNTVYNNGHGVCPGGGISWGNASGVLVKNNIITNNGTNGVDVESPATGAVISNNLTNGNGSTAILNNVGGNATVSGNITGNPLFVSGTDFHIQSGSPAKDAGLPLGAPYNVDKDAITRPQGSAYDIGAYASPISRRSSSRSKR